MAGLTGLFKRGGSFYLRIVLPKHHPLLGKYANGHYVQTLGACSHSEAVRRGTIKRASHTSLATNQGWCSVATVREVQGGDVRDVHGSPKKNPFSAL